jgi:energy-coupling factor transporter ATP-binding protein EcfA2
VLFTELVCQGVRNFAQNHRFPLGAGLTAFVGGPGSGKSTLVDLLVHLLYPDPTEPSTEAFRAQGSEVCRAALSLQDERGQTYRLVKDLFKGSMALQQLRPDGQTLTVSAQAAEIGQYLSASLHLPQRDVFEGVFLTRLASLPSRAPRPPRAAAVAEQPAGPPRAGTFVGAKAGAVMSASRKLPPSQHFDDLDGPRFPGYQGGGEEDGYGDAVLPDDPAEIRAQIETLQRDLTMARQVDELQFKLDGLQSQLFEIERGLKGLRDSEERAAQTEQALAAFRHLEALPTDFEARLKDFEAAQARLSRDLARVDEDLERWHTASEADAPPPLMKNRAFVGGLVLGLLATAAGALGFFLHEGLRWVALGNLLGFGMVLVVAMRHIDAIMSVERSRSRLTAVEERRQKLQRQFEVETAIVRKTMKEAGVEKPAQVLELFAKQKAAQAERNLAHQALEEQRGRADMAEAETRQKQLRAQVSELEAGLAAGSSLMMSPRDMEDRLKALGAKLGRLESGGAAPGPGPAGVDPADLGAGGSDGFDPTMLGMGAPPAALGGKADKGGGRQPGRLGPSALDAFDAAPPAPAPPGQEAPGEAAGPEVVARLVSLAEDLFLQDAEQLGAALCPRAAQFAAALSGGAVARLSLSARRELACADAQGVERALGELPADVQDRVYLALKAAVLEAACRRQPVPVCLDDPFRNPDPRLVDMLGRLWAGIGRLTQVVLLTSSVEQTPHATASFSL